MELVLKSVYNYLLIPVLQGLAPIASLFNDKIRESLSTRKKSVRRIKEQLATKSKTQRVWFHVASAGEFLQARPVIESLKTTNPSLTIVLTFFSPTGYHWAKSYEHADVMDYFPFDDRKTVRQLLDVIQPQLLVLTKFDLWPNMIWETHQRKVPITLISATLTQQSQRFRNPLAKVLFGNVYQKIDRIFTVSENDRDYFLQTSPGHSGIYVTGDTRSDSVLMRQEAFSQKPLAPHLEKLKESRKNIMVVGSSWPTDEKVLLGKWSEILESDPQFLLVLVPHEPTENHLSQISEALKEKGLNHTLYSEFETQGHCENQVLLVNRVGILADLYRIGTMAYVGSGKGGVHNTMEPASWSLPIFFGPRYHNAPEAVELVKQGVAFSVETSDELLEKVLDFLKNPGKAQKTGQTAREFLDRSKGATYTCANYINEELKRGRISY